MTYFFVFFGIHTSININRLYLFLFFRCFFSIFFLFNNLRLRIDIINHLLNQLIHLKDFNFALVLILNLFCYSSFSSILPS